MGRSRLVALCSDLFHVARWRVEYGQEWIRTTEGKSQQIYSLLSNRVNLTFTAN